MELRKVTAENLFPIVKLSVDEPQQNFVASNTESILEAYVTVTAGNVALPFGLYEDGELVGFVMFGYGCIGDEDEPLVAEGNYCIWRLMIDKRFQGRGLGKKAVAAALDYIKSWPCGKAEYCWLSYEPENTVAAGLYRSFGFVENGETDGDEIIAVLKL